MQQPSPLGFARITADDAQQQRKAIAQQFSDELARRAPAPEPPQKRPVGRPKREREAADVLSTASAAASAGSAGAAAALSTAVTPLDAPASKRGKYANWFASPFLSDILAAYSRCHSARTTVTMLRRAHADGRFARLSSATLQGWFDDRHQLLPQYQKQLQLATAASRGHGFTRLFAQAPDAEKDIKRLLLLMRAAGAPLNGCAPGVQSIATAAASIHFWMGAAATRLEMESTYHCSVEASGRLGGAGSADGEAHCCNHGDARCASFSHHQPRPDSSEASAFLCVDIREAQ